jgi:hypothetical protein
MDQAQKDYWFRPKRYGYGAEPSNWKGWLATFGFLFVVTAITWPLMLAPAFAGITLPVSQVVSWSAMMLVATLAFVWLCWIKTDGKWAWHWGTRD